MTRLLLALLCLATPAYPFGLEATIGSHHILATEDFEERNWGLGVYHDLGDRWTVSGGAYRNSYGDTSVYALAERRMTTVSVLGQPVDVDLFGGVAHYPGAEAKGLPHLGELVPVFGVQAEAGPVVLGFVPAINDVAKGIVTLRVRFGER